MSYLKTKLTALILIIVLIASLYGFAGKQEETKITKTVYARSKGEAIEIAKKYLYNDWDYIFISKTVFYSDKEKGLEYEIHATRYE